MKNYSKGSHVVFYWLWNMMPFLHRKRVKFNVDLQVCNLSDVPLVNAVLFAKVRLLEGGTFEDQTERVGVVSHGASWSHRSSFSCRISSDPSSGTLEKCLCRISIRKEQKGGKSYAKLGYVDINLSEFAASGVEGITRSYLLDGYGLNTRQDNSKVQVKVTMNHQSLDPVFRVPLTAGAIEDKSLNPVDRKAPQAETDSVEEDCPGSAAVSFRTNNVAVDGAAESSSAGGSSGGGAEDSASVVSESRRVAASSAITPTPAIPSTSICSSTGTTSTALRRLSQDRTSVPRVQNTRIDAGGVIDRMLAESHISETDDVPSGESEGLALYVDRDGAAVVGPQGPGLQKVTMAEETPS